MNSDQLQQLLATQPAWPPHTCIPAFVYNALQVLQLPSPTPADLARIIDVRVGPEDSNPFNLKHEPNTAERGVPQRKASITIDNYLRATHPGFNFRHIRFSTIALQSYPDVLIDALAKGIQVGLGGDPTLLPVEARPDNQHVVSIVDANQRSVSMVDFSVATPAVFTADWPTVERSVFAIDGGYWMIGRESLLHFSQCLPWNSESQSRSY